MRSEAGLGRVRAKTTAISHIPRTNYIDKDSRCKSAYLVIDLHASAALIEQLSKSNLGIRGDL